MSDPKFYDDGAFSVDEGVHGWQSFSREGEKIIFSHSEEDCIYWSRRWLKAQQEGWGDNSKVVNSGVVGGKL